MNLFELFVKIGVDDQASKNISNIAGKLGNGLKTAAKVGTAAVGAAAAGITALTTAAVNNYAEYEQLVGGVETLFKDSANTLMSYASEAYKAQGISANEYMSLATSFSASLLQSLEGDTQKAVEATNLAITDMSDNANKMGTSMELIQNAYNGFAKENYTMLDNLKLGYGGTKEEMARLIADAAELSDTVDAQSMSFDNIVEAIHVVQTEMGITGTTAKEASTTISGSVGTMKAAWTDFLTSLADENADYQWQLDNLLESVKTVAVNVFPLVEQVFWSISDMVEDVFPEIASKIPQIISEVLPRITEIAVKLVESLVGGISENQEMLMTTAFETITYLANSFITMLPQIVQLGLDLIVSLANGIAESLPELIPAIVDVVLQIVDILTSPDTLNSLIGAALEIMLGLAEGLIKAIPDIVAAIPTIIENLIQALIDAIPQIIEAGIQLFVALVENLPAIIAGIVKAIPEIIMAILEGLASLGGELADLFSEAWEGIKDVFSGVGDWFKEKFTEGKEKANEAWSNAKELFSKNWENVKAGYALVGDWFEKTFKEGKERANKAWSNAKELFSKNWENVKAGYGAVGDWFSKTFKEGKDGAVNAWSNVKETFSGIWDKIKEIFSKGSDIGENIISGIKNGISNAWGNLKDWFSGLFDDLIGGAKKILGIASPSKVFKKIGGFTAEGFGIGFENEFSSVKKEVEDAMRFDDVPIRMDASVSKFGSGSYGMDYDRTSSENSTINIVINGAQYSDEDSLAEAISYRLQEMMERRARA